MQAKFSFFLKKFYTICRNNILEVWARHKPGSVLSNHLSRLTVTNKLQPPTYRTATGRRLLCPIWCCSEWGLHERYVTISPCELLPHNFNLTTALPVSAECFCCTFPIVTYARRYLASSPYGARTFLIPCGTRLSALPILNFKRMMPWKALNM